MWPPYRDAARAVLPQATIIVDKCHVVRMANDAVESARKATRENLTPKQRRGLMRDRFVLLKHERDLTDQERLLMDGWTKNHPLLGDAYRLKETFTAPTTTRRRTTPTKPMASGSSPSPTVSMGASSR